MSYDAPGDARRPDYYQSAPSYDQSGGDSETRDPGGWNAVIFAKVPSGAVGVRTSVGKILDEQLGEGLTMKAPWETVVMMSTRLQADRVNAEAASQDLQKVGARLTVPFSLNPKDAPAVYKNVGNLDQVEAIIINPGVMESLKAVSAKYTAEQLITMRPEVKENVEKALKAYIEQALKDKGIPGAINIGNIAITDFQFSPEFNASIEMKVKAAQDALRAEMEKKQIVTQAEAQRDSQKARADGLAYTVGVQSTAEAAAIKRRADALSANPDIIKLNAVEKWDEPPAGV